MLSHEYETIIIVRPDIEDTAVFGIAEKIEAIVLESEGHVLDREDWGKRKLAYPIAKHQRGHFLRLNYLCAPALVAEIERRIRNDNDKVVRFMTLRLAIDVDAPTRIEEAAIQRARREEEQRRRAAEAALGLGDDDDDEFGEDEDDDDMGDGPR